MFTLNYSDHRPIYEQIKERLKQLILSGAMHTDAQLPSVRELALQLAINPNTIQRAYKELEAEGYIYSVRAKGSFVAPVRTTTMESHREKLYAQLGKTVKELAFAGASKDDVISYIKSVYDEGGYGK